jgi:hypothetical protein
VTIKPHLLRCFLCHQAFTASQKVHLRCCASSFVIATYDKYASFLNIRTPCICPPPADYFAVQLMTLSEFIKHCPLLNPGLTNSIPPEKALLMKRPPHQKHLPNRYIGMPDEILATPTVGGH